MKTQLLAGAAIAALIAAGPALAADLPLKAPPLVAAAWNWSGFYIGGHGGYGWGRNSQTDINDPFFTGKFPGFNIPGFDPKGFLGGVQAGANWQTGAIVAGLEGDLSFADIKGSSSATPTPAVGLFGITNTGTAANSGTFDLLGSGRARLGYLVTPNLLLYGTGGLAWSHFVQSAALTSTNFDPFAVPTTVGLFVSTSTPSWRFGWVAGLGAEARLFDTNWLARLEYLHYDFGNSGSASTVGGFFALPSSRTSGDLTVDVVRAGLSYKFDPDRFGFGYAGAAGPAPGGPVYKAPPPAVLPWTWAGFYLGAHAGYGWGHDPFNNLLVAGVPLFGVDSRGFVGGFQAGANWQSGSFVGGLEIDLSGTDIKGSTSNAIAGAVVAQATQSEKFDRLGSARARVGYLASPSVLLYATGGPGWARMVTDQETVTPFAGIPSLVTSTVTPNWLFGWVAGAGVEARLWNTNWLARVEYLHYDFGSGTSTQFTPAGGGLVITTTSGHLTNDVVRAGLSYKFEWPGYAGGTQNAMAAMPVAAAPAAVWNWSGFYIGGHGGYGWGRDPFSMLVTGTEPGLVPPIPPVILTGVNSHGFVGGFQAGANWQTGSMVGGLELDLSGSDIKGTSTVAGVDTGGAPVRGTQTDKFDLLGSARARLGYLVWPSVLLYGTGGLAWTRLEQTVTSVNSDGTTITTTPSWRFGWTAGAGGEVRLWDTNWLARLEYLHYDFGNSGGIFGGFSAGGAVDFVSVNTMSRHLTADVVRAGFGYKFD